MAATQYQLFCRCINTVTNKAITNKEIRKWVSIFDQARTPDVDNEDLYIKETLKFNINGNPNEESMMQEEIINGAKITNIKYNLLFVYSGCDIYYANGNTGDTYVLTDKFERTFMTPWFIHSTHSSLNSVMEKAQALASKIGHDNIMLGKVVSLDQYIDIV